MAHLRQCQLANPLSIHTLYLPKKCLPILPVLVGLLVTTSRFWSNARRRLGEAYSLCHVWPGYALNVVTKLSLEVGTEIMSSNSTKKANTVVGHLLRITKVRYD